YTKMNTRHGVKEIPFTGGIQIRVVVAGAFASTVRAIIETPLELAKVRRQTGQSWQFKGLYRCHSWLVGGVATRIHEVPSPRKLRKCHLLPYPAPHAVPSPPIPCSTCSALSSHTLLHMQCPSLPVPSPTIPYYTCNASPTHTLLHMQCIPHPYPALHVVPSLPIPCSTCSALSSHTLLHMQCPPTPYPVPHAVPSPIPCSTCSALSSHTLLHMQCPLLPYPAPHAVPSPTIPYYTCNASPTHTLLYM
ncbi:hypothetical protein QZH41_009505, partial [Actinostola sp. cb2023]